MSKSNPIDFKSKLSAPSPVAAFNMMLGGANQKDIRELKISSLFPYPNQPFKSYTHEKLLELAEDIKANGVLSPVLVRPYEDSYQIIVPNLNQRQIEKEILKILEQHFGS